MDHAHLYTKCLDMELCITEFHGLDVHFFLFRTCSSEFIDSMQGCERNPIDHSNK